MKNITTAKKIFIGFLFSFLCVGFFLLVTFSNVRKNTMNVNEMNTSFSILRSVENVFVNMQDLENGLRGFIITGKESFLDSYFKALQKRESDLAELLSASKENSSRLADASALTDLVNKKTAFAKEAVNIRKVSGLVAAQQFINTEIGKKLMDDIRKLVSKIETRERILLHFENKKLLERSQKTLDLFFILALSVFSFLLISFVVIRRDLLKRKNLDLIVMNTLDDAGAGFNYDTNKITMIAANGEIVSHELKSKRAVAKDVVNKIIELQHA